MNKNKKGVNDQNNQKKILDKHKTWLLIGVSIAVVAVLVLVLYSPVRKALIGKAFDITPLQYCKTDSDCSIRGYVCVYVEGAMKCRKPCATNADCAYQNEKECALTAGKTFCQCFSNTDCPSGMICSTDYRCELLIITEIAPIAYTPFTDSDGDGVPDAQDNCPDASNPDQADIDGDGTGDICDTDDDNDGFLDTQDDCPNMFNPDQADLDGDRIGTDCDNCPDVSNPDQADIDGDGTGDICDNCPDTPAGVQVDEHGCTALELCTHDYNCAWREVCFNGVCTAINCASAADCPLLHNCENGRCTAFRCGSDADCPSGVTCYQGACDVLYCNVNADCPAGQVCIEKTCVVDSDGDGVPDTRDNCPDTPAGVQVNEHGCEVAAAPVAYEPLELICDDGLDNDGDGATDCADSDCVSNVACVDSDSDGVPDAFDVETTLNCPADLIVSTDEPNYLGGWVEPCCNSVPGCVWEGTIWTGRCVSEQTGEEGGSALSCADTLYSGLYPSALSPIFLNKARKLACIGPCQFTEGGDNSAKGDACVAPVNLGDCSDGLDNDGDGLIDCDDNCAADPACAPEQDSDSDGVLDTQDNCPNTPAGVQVDATGCEAAAAILGDVNNDGEITNVDAILVQRHVLGIATLTSEEQQRGNVNYCVAGQEELTNVDAILIQRYVLGIISAFPC